MSGEARTTNDSLGTRVRHFLEMIRFSHTLFALPFALLAAVMAWYADAHSSPPRGWRPLDLVGILLCMTFARSAAMAFNRLVDRDVDAANPRTRNRHIPAGLLSVGAATAFALASGALFVASTLIFLPNWLPLALSLPILAFLLGYSLTKRFTALAHYWLGAALMIAPMAAWIAVRGEVVSQRPADLLPAALLGLAVFFWVGGFDVIYACQDADFDRQAGLHSIPARLGVSGALRLAAASHVAAVLCLLALPWVWGHFGKIYLAGVLTVAVLLVYEHSLVRPDDLSRVNLAFFHVNTVVSVGMLVVGSLDLWLL